MMDEAEARSLESAIFFSAFPIFNFISTRRIFWSWREKKQTNKKHGRRPQRRPWEETDLGGRRQISDPILGVSLSLSPEAYNPSVVSVRGSLGSQFLSAQCVFVLVAGTCDSIVYMLGIRKQRVMGPPESSWVRKVLEGSRVH